ncbi:tyrosine-type recombinase/integrase [Mesorhizobium sp. M0615]|uniref:tyrosine-type recombinase/integrase n=1 Tax=Mesorhizobium sp. M0615 TaxID=2956971 RepID=UPI00333D0D4A
MQGKGRKDRSVPLWRTTANLIRNWKRRLDYGGKENFLFPNRGGGCMARSNVTQRLEFAVSASAERYPQLARRSISAPHTICHTTAMHLLQSGVDISVIALWLGQ